MPCLHFFADAFSGCAELAVSMDALRCVCVCVCGMSEKGRVKGWGGGGRREREFPRDCLRILADGFFAIPCE